MHVSGKRRCKHDLFPGSANRGPFTHADSRALHRRDPHACARHRCQRCNLHTRTRRPTTLSEVTVEGIRTITSRDLELAASRNQVIKLIALAERKDNDYQFSVRPTTLERSHPLAAVSADMMAVIYYTDINGTIFASSEEEDPYPTAAAVLRDIVHVATI